MPATMSRDDQELVTIAFGLAELRDRTDFTGEMDDIATYLRDHNRAGGFDCDIRYADGDYATISDYTRVEGRTFSAADLDALGILVSRISGMDADALLDYSPAADLRAIRTGAIVV